MVRLKTALLLFAALNAAQAPAQMIGVNVVLNTPPSSSVLAQLEEYGQIHDVIPEINGVTLRAHADDLPAIQTLSCVAAAGPDTACALAGMPPVPVPDFALGANLWNLDAINVTDFGTTRTIPYDGDGVYVAVIDSGLPHNWREYFPVERIATQFAISFGGGGGEVGTVSMQPEKWEHDTLGHGTKVTSILLGFRYYGQQDFNGVAPKVTIIPVKTFKENDDAWSSVLIRAIVYVTNLKSSGLLGAAPVIINLSSGGLTPDPLMRAAIDNAIAQGIVVVAAGGNGGAGGMWYPGAYPEVISAAASGWVGQFGDLTSVWWILDDVLENDASECLIAPFSSAELPGQDLDVAAPGFVVPVAYTRAGQADYTFFHGTSGACPHVAGVAALMLQKNPGLTQGQIETILESTAMPIGSGCRNAIGAGVSSGNEPTWSDSSNVFFFPTTFCWDATVTGHGLLQADAALNATPFP